MASLIIGAILDETGVHGNEVLFLGLISPFAMLGLLAASFFSGHKRFAGGVLAGSAQISLAALGPIRTRLRWQEDISLKPRPVGWTLAPLVDWGTAWMFSRAVDAMIDGG